MALFLGAGTCAPAAAVVISPFCLIVSGLLLSNPSPLPSCSPSRKLLPVIGGGGKKRCLAALTVADSSVLSKSLSCLIPPRLCRHFHISLHSPPPLHAQKFCPRMSSLPPLVLVLEISLAGVVVIHCHGGSSSSMVPPRHISIRS